MKRNLAALLLLLAAPAFGGTTTLTEDGNNLTATMSSTYATYNFQEICAAFEIHKMPCSSTLDYNGDGVQEPWLVDGGICTQQESDDGVLAQNAAGWGTPTCDATALAANRCRGPEDPIIDMTGWTIMNGSACALFQRAIRVQQMLGWRNTGIRILERLNQTLTEPSGGLED